MLAQCVKVDIYLNYQMPTTEFVGFTETYFGYFNAVYFSRQLLIVKVHAVYILSK